MLLPVFLGRSYLGAPGYSRITSEQTGGGGLQRQDKGWGEVMSNFERAEPVRNSRLYIYTKLIYKTNYLYRIDTNLIDLSNDASLDMKHGYNNYHYQ